MRTPLRDRPRRGVKGSRHVVLPLGITVGLTLLWACRSSEHDAAWRHGQERLIAEAVLHDLAEMPALSHNDVRATFCVGVGENLGTSAQDPDPALLEPLGRGRAGVFPGSVAEG